MECEVIKTKEKKKLVEKNNNCGVITTYTNCFMIVREDQLSTNNDCISNQKYEETYNYQCMNQPLSIMKGSHDLYVQGYTTCVGNEDRRLERLHCLGDE